MDSGAARAGLARIEERATDTSSISPMLKYTCMFLLCLVAAIEGADVSLFPATLKAWEEDLGLSPLDVGTLGMAQAVSTACGGPVWGILAARAVISRKRIVVLGCVAQGLLLLMISVFTSFPVLIFIRSLNGLALASLRPIAGSIIADIFEDLERGRMFGWINLSTAVGAAVCGMITATVSRQTLFGIHGWQVAFATVGALSIALGLVISSFLEDFKVKMPAGTAGTVSLRAELKTLRRLMEMPTFVFVMLQGCLGVIPWRALDYRLLFFQYSGLNDLGASTVASVGQLSMGPGCYLGGVVGDMLAKWHPLKGRIWCAQATVFFSILVTFLTFGYAPPSSMVFGYYLFMVIALGLTGSWAAAGTNGPLLCTIVPEHERPLVLAWEGAIGGSVGALGPFVFGFLAEVIFGYDLEAPATGENALALRQALFWSCAVPWSLCGGLYTALHWSYPRDLADNEGRQTQKLKQDAYGSTA